MGVIRKFNRETGQWEIYGSTDAKDINLLDVGDNFENKNVESAFREVSNKLNRTLAELEAQRGTLVSHASELQAQRGTLVSHATELQSQKKAINTHTEDIEFLKEFGGGGGGGAAAPTITSTFENCSVDKETEVKIPIYFSSPNLGEGTVYIIVNNIEIGSIPGIKMGNNVINVGKMTESINEVCIYVKDRTGMLSNQLTWTIKSGGIELTIDFDDTADYLISDMIFMQYYVTTASDDPLKMYITIDYDEYEVECNKDFNEYVFPQLGIGIHKISLYITDGTYLTATKTFNIVIVNSNSLYVSSTFKNGQETSVGSPVAIQYRVSKASTESFDVKLYLNDKLYKTLSCTPGTYYWTLNDLSVGSYTAKIEVSGAYDETQTIELNFEMVSSGYDPIKVIENGLVYRLSARGRTNQDSDKEHPIDNSGNNVQATLHGFNYFSNGWINGELVCDGEAYVEIDYYPYKDNALYGSTIEINYTALDIGFTDSRILDYTDSETDKGIFVDIESIIMASLNNSGELETDKDREITVSFVIDRRAKFAKIFIDGICSRAFTLADSGSGTSAIREDFTHAQKIYLNSRKGKDKFGACKIKDFRIYNRVLTDDEIVSNYIAQISDLAEQEKQYNFNFDNKTLPVIRMYGDTTNMTLETPVTMRIKYTSPDEDKYGQSFDLPYCDVNWQGTSSLQYVLKNFTARLKDENMAPYMYSPYPGGVKEDVYCFKCDYMESSHSRNVGISKFVNSCLYDTKNPMQQKDPAIRNSVNGFPCLMYINDELQGVYNFNLDRYSTKSFGYTDPDKVLVYEISANSDTTAGAFYSWTEASGRDKATYYNADFECLYPPTRAAGNDNMSELIRLIEWVDTSSDEDFKDNMNRYFNIEYLLRYYLNVLVFGLVDSLGKNAKLASFDGGLTWYFQFYDSDTSCGLNNSGFLQFGSDIEMGDKNVFNTTGSRLWKRVVELFQTELRQQYSLMRQDRFTVDNIMSYIYGEQISKIPPYYYNKDMQSKYLNFGNSYLYALHGSNEHHLRRWIRERIMYVDTLLGYNVSSADYITIRANKQGYAYIDIEMYQPMYVTVQWRDEDGGTGNQVKRVGRGEKVRFEYNIPTATDQNILVYAGHQIKSLGDLSNLCPSTLLIANADRLTEIVCHSPNLINTDFSECTLLQKIDISDCTALGTGIGAQPILNVERAKYLRYLNARNTQLTSITIMQSGSNLEEIYYPNSVQSITLVNQAYLKIAGIPYEVDAMGRVTNYCEKLSDIEINNCKYIDHLQYPFNEGDELTLDAIKQVQNLKLINSLDKLNAISFKGFYKLKNLTLSSMHNITALGFDDMLNLSDNALLEKISVSDCPLINEVSFNISSPTYKIEFAPGAIVDLGGVQSINRIESNASISGLDTLIIPTSLKELVFDGKEGCNVKNVWSAAANHSQDEFQGMDLLDVSLEYLDMNKLDGITNAINFHITPTKQHPNMNTSRYSNFFKPEGSINLTNYTGEMKGMLKGVDLEKLDVIIDKAQEQTDLTGLFESAIIPVSKLDKVNEILEKYDRSDNWKNLFKNADVGFDAPDIIIPDESSYREMNLSGMFYGTDVSTDIEIQGNMIDVSEMFRNCRKVKQYLENWNSVSLHPDIKTNNCYMGTGGDLELVPCLWGGYGFYPDVTSEIVVEIPTNNYTLKLVTKAKLTTEYGIVNWGDGVVNSLLDNNYSHTYTRAGIYTIKGHFTFGGQINTAEMLGTLKEVKHIADKTTNLSQAFSYCSKLEKVDLGVRKLTEMSECFTDCAKLTTILMSEIDTSEITDMSALFNNCQSLTSLNLSHFNTDKVTSMNNMFGNCQKLTSLNISSFNTENVTNMNRMFYYCRILPSIDISHFVTDKVESMSYMFYGCNNLSSLDISNFNTSKVNNMASMFKNCNNLSELNLSNFDTKNVTNMAEMFQSCNKLTSLNISSFDTTNVTDMNHLFTGCSLLEAIDISNFVTDKVTNMSYMFSECKLLGSLDIRHFNTEKVTNMSYMFSECESLTELDVSNFNTAQVTNMSYMFKGCPNILTLDLQNFDTKLVTNMMSMFENCQNTQVINVSSFDTSSVSNISKMFNNCRKVAVLDIKNFDLTKVSSLNYFFSGCASVTSLDISSWNVENITDMSYLFYNCYAVTSLDINGWNTNKVTNASNLFYNCAKLSDLNLSNWILESCTDFSNMFNGCSGLVTLDISKFNTANVINMSYMFASCSKIKTLNLDNFNTAKVTNMRNMFNGCSSLTKLNINHFDTTKLTNISYAFSGLVCDVVFTNKANPVLTNAQAMFNVYYGTSIDLSNFSLANSTNNTNFTISALNLLNFIAPSNINASIKFVADKLTHTSLMSIINNLNIVNKATILEIGAKNIAKLSEEELAIAINKGWTVC